MYSLIELKTLVSSGRDPARSLPLRRGFLLIPLILVCFAFLPQMQGQLPPEIPGNPDGCYPAFTTAEGCNALHQLFGGIGNTAVGWYSNFLAGNASFNTSVGAGTLALDSGAGSGQNTAVGTAAMILNLSGNSNVAVGSNALVQNATGSFNNGVGSFVLYNNDVDGAGTANNNNAFGAFALFSNVDGASNSAFGDDALEDNQADGLTAVGASALTFNSFAVGSTAVGSFALAFNDFSGNGFAVFNNAVGAAALLSNVDGFGNNAFGNSALFNNVFGAENTAIGDDTLPFNDSDGLGLANNNVAVGGAALFNNVDGSENTAVGTGAGPNVVVGFNNTYLGDFVGTLAVDESDTIRIGDLSNGNGAGSLECFIGGIFNNFQPVGGTVVEVTLDLADDHLGWDVGPSGAPTVPSRGAPVKRGAPQPAARPQAKALPQHQAMLNDRVDKLQAVVQLQQKLIASLTAQVKEQAAQIQRVSAQVEMIKPAPRVVENR